MALRICLPAVAPVKTPSHIKANVLTIGMAINHPVKSVKRANTTVSEVIIRYIGIYDKANRTVKTAPTPSDHKKSKRTREDISDAPLGLLDTGRPDGLSDIGFDLTAPIYLPTSASPAYAKPSTKYDTSIKSFMRILHTAKSVSPYIDESDVKPT